MQHLTRCFFVAALALHAAASVQAQQNAMTFFITSVGSGKGGDLGSLAGADRHCQELAQMVGVARGTVSNHLIGLRGQGILSLNRRGITLHRADRLRRRLG